MSEESKPDFVFRYPDRLKINTEQHKQFTDELNRVTKLIVGRNRTQLIAQLREKVEGMEKFNFVNNRLVPTKYGVILMLSEVLSLLDEIEGEMK